MTSKKFALLSVFDKNGIVDLAQKLAGLGYSLLSTGGTADALKEAGVPVTFDRIEGWPHVMDFFSPISERTLWQCYNFLKTHVPSDEMLKNK